MDVDRLNRWLTLGDNIGVLAGIVFLALEIQQNTAATHSSTVQSITDNSAAALREFAGNADLAQVRVKGDFENSSLSELESFQYWSLNRGYWIHFQNIYFQIGLGALEPRVWASYKRIICADLAGRPGLRIRWDEHAAVLDPDFVVVVEDCLQTGTDKLTSPDKCNLANIHQATAAFHSLNALILRFR
jgi:hypothetical protein